MDNFGKNILAKQTCSHCWAIRRNYFLCVITINHLGFKDHDYKNIMRLY